MGNRDGVKLREISHLMIVDAAIRGGVDLRDRFVLLMPFPESEGTLEPVKQGLVPRL